MPAPIEGVPCEISSRSIRRAIREVLRAVQAKPKDWARVRSRILSFRESEFESDPATVGQWIEDGDEVGRLIQRAQDDPRHWADPDPQYVAKGWVVLASRLSDDSSAQRLATVAHEIGHVATREGDVTRRYGVCGDSDWASEGAADFYAFKWGYGPQIRSTAKSRMCSHHAGLPGDLIRLGETTYRIDHNHYLRPVADARIKASPPNGASA